MRRVVAEGLRFPEGPTALGDGSFAVVEMQGEAVACVAPDGSVSPLGDLGSSYIGSWMGDAINLGAAISAFASSLGTATGASRILYAMGRDGFGTSRLGTSSPRTTARPVSTTRPSPSHSWR